MYSTDLWAPELHKIDDKWYIIFTGDPNYGVCPKPPITITADKHDRHTFAGDRCILSIQLSCGLPPYVRVGEQR
jgi:hypothetical protein